MIYDIVCNDIFAFCNEKCLTILYLSLCEIGNPIIWSTKVSYVCQYAIYYLVGCKTIKNNKRTKCCYRQ